MTAGSPQIAWQVKCWPRTIVGSRHAHFLLFFEGGGVALKGLACHDKILKFVCRMWSCTWRCLTALSPAPPTSYMAGSVHCTCHCDWLIFRQDGGNCNDDDDVMIFHQDGGDDEGLVGHGVQGAPLIGLLLDPEQRRNKESSFPE